MSEAAQLWIFGIVGSSIAALYFLFLAHIRSAQRLGEKLVEIDVRLTSIKEDVGAIEREIGSHETGIRGGLHKLREETRRAIEVSDKSTRDAITALSASLKTDLKDQLKEHGRNEQLRENSRPNLR